MEIEKATFVIADTETTGLLPETDRVVEVALVKIQGLKIVESWSQIVDPGIPIPPTASAIHHLTDEDVAGALTLKDLELSMETFSEGAAMVAHSAEFDASFLPMLRGRWICTERLAKHLWPYAPAFKNEVLRYWLKLKIDCIGSPHRALFDATVTANIFIQQLNHYLSLGLENTVDGLAAFAAAPITIEKWPFGKHKDLPIKETPRSYLEWAIKNMTDIDQDLRWSIENAYNGGKQNGSGIDAGRSAADSARGFGASPVDPGSNEVGDEGERALRQDPGDRQAVSLEAGGGKTDVNVSDGA